MYWHYWRNIGFYDWCINQVSQSSFRDFCAKCCVWVPVLTDATVQDAMTEEVEMPGSQGSKEEKMEKDSKQFLIQGDVYEVEKLVGIKIVKVDIQEFLHLVYLCENYLVCLISFKLFLNSY